MMNLSELLRKLNNLISIGTISETKSAEGKALARVKILDRVTDFYPVVSFSNTFKRHFIPIRVNEQVLVFSPFGDASSGFIIRGIFNRGRKEHPLSNEHTEVIDYEDGTVISYDTQSKELKVNAVNKVILICKSADIKAESYIVNSDSIDLITKSLKIKSDTTTFEGGKINHDGIDISKTHNHPQNAGDHFGGGANTNPPNGE